MHLTHAKQNWNSGLTSLTNVKDPNSVTLFVQQNFAMPSLETVAERRRRLELCVKHLGDWCSSRRLQLNPDKTELMWFGFRSHLTKLSQLDTSLNLGSVVIEILASS